VCSVAASDPIIFDAEGIRVMDIRVGLGFEVHRDIFSGHIGRTRVRCQFDVGYGDSVHPPPERVSPPSLLGDPTATMLAYRPETVVAEKLHAIVVHGERNTRFKDYFDLDYISRHTEFDFAALRGAVIATFHVRRTTLVAELPPGLGDTYAISPSSIRGWSARLRSSGIDGAPEFRRIVERIRGLVLPVLALPGTSISPPPLLRTWNPESAWR